MGLLECWGCARTFRGQVELIFITLVIFRFSIALGQKSVIFQYQGEDEWIPSYYPALQVPGVPNADIREIQNDSIACTGKFYSSDSLLSTDNSDLSGRCLYKDLVQLFPPNASSVMSFSTMFSVSILPKVDYKNITTLCTALYDDTVQGLAFIIGSDSSMQGAAGGYLGWLNSTTNGNASTPHNFAVEIDFVQDVEFQDPPDIHVGVNKNSMTSVNTSTIEWISGSSLGSTLDGYLNLTIWIDYNGRNQILEVFVTGTGDFVRLNSNLVSDLDYKPTTPIISTVVDLTDIFSRDGMFVGFSGSISQTLFYLIAGWTFNSNGLAPDIPRNASGMVSLDDDDDDARRRTLTIILNLVITIPVVLVFLALLFTIYVLYKRSARLAAITKRHKIEKGALEQGPQNFKYKVLRKATKGFSSHELLGTGGFGSVYKGKITLRGEERPTDIAVKRLSATSRQGAQEFLAEVKIIGRAQHRNLVRLLGWCHERGELLLVYDYMPHGSVNQHLYKAADHPFEEPALTWAKRLKIVSGVAKGLAYLHEEWEQRVIHRDVKSSNVMLDGDFNARLGDFGLARISEHGDAPPSTAVLAGTYGYMAPEFVQTLKATEKTDVYSFGALVLEIATGKRPLLSVEDRRAYNKIFLVDWVWDLYKDDILMDAVDCRLQNAYDLGEMLMFLKIGLLCSHPDPDNRPSMREVIDIWKGTSPFPPLPSSKPVPVYDLNIVASISDTDKDADTSVATAADNYGQADESRAQTFPRDSEDHLSLTIPSEDHGGSLLPENLIERRSGPPYPALRRRPCSMRSLPF